MSRSWKDVPGGHRRCPRPTVDDVSRRAANYIRIFAAWTVFVWVTFIRNVSRDRTHSTGFKVVHITLAVVSLAFTVGAVWVVARERRGRERHSVGISEPPATSPTPAVRRKG